MSGRILRHCGRILYNVGSIRACSGVFMGRQLRNDYLFPKNSFCSVRQYSTSFPRNEVIPFHLSDIGEGIAQVEVTKWLVKEGDVVSEFDSICEAASDKATVVITSKYSGKIVHIVEKPDNTYAIGEKLFDIEVASDGSPKVETVKEVTPPQKSEGEVKKTSFNATDDTSDSKKGMYGFKSRFEGRSRKEFTPKKSGEVVKLTGYDPAMFKAMTKSLEIPHFHVCEEHDIDKLMRHLKYLKKTHGKEQKSISLFPLVLKAVALALREHPRLNSHFIDSTSVHHKDIIDINIAVSTFKGLASPIIRSVDTISLREISERVEYLKVAAPKGLTRADVEIGSFTISNFGSVGGIFGTPVITSPQVAIGGFGRVLKRVVIEDESDCENCTCRNHYYLPSSWAADHRVVSGTQLIELVKTFDELITDPIYLLFKA